MQSIWKWFLTVAAVLCVLGNVLAVEQAVRTSKPAPRSTTGDPGLPILLHAGPIDPGAMTNKQRTLAPGARYGIVQFESREVQNAAILNDVGARVLDYLHHNAYLLRLDGARAEAIRALPGVRALLPFLPEYKISPMIRAEAKRANGQIRVLGFRGELLKRLKQAVRHLAPSAHLMTSADLHGQPFLLLSVPAPQAVRISNALAHSDQVMWLESQLQMRSENTDSVGPIQANADSGGVPPTATPIWDQGITGAGQILTVVDSGVDRNLDFFRRHDNGSSVTDAFTDAEFPIPPEIGTLFPDNKIVGYFVHDESADPYDTGRSCGGGLGAFHGSHTAGSMLGDAGATASPTDPNYDAGDGMAPNAQLLVQDVTSDAGCITSSIGFDTYLQSRNAGSYISNHSYGAPVLDDDGNVLPERLVYTGSEFEIDLFTFLYDDYLYLTSAGNGGPGETTLSHPSYSKNALVVAATEHGNDSAIAEFSSRGPSFDGRIKPDISAPGVDIMSARGDSQNDLPPPAFGGNGLRTQTGTSMASPAVVGAAGLARQYFTDGFYPDGVRNADNALRPFGSLLKAVLLNGARTYPDTPANDSGWGRVWLDSNLYFAGDDRGLRVWTIANGDGLETGDTHEFQVQVGAGEEFRATLVWYDPPGSLLSSGPSLVNDLNLEVVTNDATYRGNVFNGGRSSAGGGRDSINTVEQVHLPSPEAGLYTVRVQARSVPGNGVQNTDRQGYALVVSAAQCDTAVIDAPEISLSQGPEGVQVEIDTVTGASGYQVYRALGNCSAPTAEFQFVGAGSGAVEDLRTQGGFDYAYQARGVDACGEGPAGGCQTLLSTAACTLLPDFDPASVLVARTPGNTCGVDISWDAGSNRCPGATLTYDVYRSTDPFFSADSDTLVASAVSATRFHDPGVDPLTTYYYGVKAEDSSGDGSGPEGGNLSLGLQRLPITTFADTSSPGTFTDDPDTISLVDRDVVWRITGVAASTGQFSYHNAADFSDYAPDTCARIVTPLIQLQAGASPQLSYDARFEIEVDWDGVIVEISSDGGQSWQDLPPDGGYPGTLNMTEPTRGTPINGCGYPATQGAFTGDQDTFRSYSSDLSGFAGQEVMVRWSFTSDPGLEFEGFYLDNIQITDASTPDACIKAAGVTKAMSGPWFNADQANHGWLIEVIDSPTKAAELVNAYWYVYNDGEPVWLLGIGSVDGSTANLDVFITDGANFPPDFDQDDVNLHTWGTMSFEFDSETSGTASWSPVFPGFTAGSVAMTQIAPISDSEDSCHSGSYYNRDQNGHGFVAQVINIGGVESVILAWYVYQDGQQVWLFGSGPLLDDVAAVAMEIFSGADFPPDFDSNDVVRADWGTVIFSFTGSATATASWTSNIADYADGNIELERLTQLSGHACP